ncbi:NAD-dependent succinate-semialdehyde dehydrogenase [Pseudofrankia saprophytica]|uniref:NAD-dependent succinate-semialdehyde dehydrogenase n=1 Tax=Pseudofrankia saprophytica TaxID=298655 RepID=UPI000234B1CA|nr:NAD-dependent succinate-semialdehyde dehydrogenase [Pseudofrankia saprophytica]
MTSTTATAHQLLIGGRWTAASEGTSFSVTDPATERVIADVASAGPADALAGIDAAQRAGADWAAVSPRQRSVLLRRVYSTVMAEADELADLIVAENGKVRADALAEVRYAAEFFRWYAEEAVRNYGQLLSAPDGGADIVVRHQPIGTALLVTPWNFPLAMATRKIAPALAAGCGTLLKPAEETPLTALALGRILARCDIPDGLVNILPTADPGPLVEAVLRDPRVRKLSFTGSTEVGRLLLRQAADQVISCSMELGGNAPFLVHADADVAAAVDGAMVAKMRNGGQACTAANRFYVHRRVVAEFTERFAERMRSVSVGPGSRAGVDLGPVINRRAQVSMGTTVASLTQAGAQVVTGAAEQRPGWFYAPTVLADVPPEADALRHEIFGPVAPVVTFDDADEAVALANDTGYGLAAYLYTRDLRLATHCSEALEFGMVAVNRGLLSDPAAPFGGMKGSGLGREGGHDGLLEFTETKYVSVAR